MVVQGPLGGGATSIGYYAGAMQSGMSPRRSVMDLAPGVGNARIPVVVVSRSAALRLVPSLESLQRAIDSSFRTVSAEVASQAALTVRLDRDPYTARNVVGIIEGSDPELRRQAIVVGAHYDHDGTDGGRIWNGADDNASGTSALLELAEAFALDRPPARTVILSAWAAEEKGMLGSRNYVREPPIPIGDTVAMFQIDMIGRNEEHPANPREGFLLERAADNENALNLIGSVFSADLREVVEDMNAGVGLDLRFRYDYGAENLIRRSDHWTFLSRGVPSLFFFGGLHPDYHTPDDTAEKINYPKIEKVARLVYLALHEIGNAPERPGFSNPAD
jgi:Zn-dependent M28 family amino/carboxypeptidase